MIAADPANWNVATDALIRAVSYDGLGLNHPAVSTLLEVLVPIAEPNWDKDLPEFPEEDGLVFQLGGCALVDAVWAVVGVDSLSDVLGVLLPLLGDAVLPWTLRLPPTRSSAPLPSITAVSSLMTPKCWSGSGTSRATRW